MKDQRKNKEIEDIVEFLSMSEDEKLKKVFKTKFKTDRDDLIIKLELFDWKVYVDEFNKEYEIFWEQLELPKKYENAYATKMLLKRRLIEQVVYNLFLEYVFLNSREEEKNYSKKIRPQIVDTLKLYRGIGIIYKIDKEEIEDLFKKQLDENKRLADVGKKFLGKAMSKHNIYAYELILEKNEKYREEFEKDNYRTATFKIAPIIGISKDHKEEVEKLYKSFKLFQNKYKIYTVAEFKKFLSSYRS